MADSEELELLEVSSSPSTQTIQIITDSNEDGPDGVDAHVNEDFLQQALVEAQGFEQAPEQYGDEVGNDAVTQEMVNNVVSISNLVTSAGATVIADGAFDGSSYTVVGEIPDTDAQDIIDLQQNVIGVDSDVQMVSEEQTPEEEQAVQNISSLVETNPVMTETPVNVQFVSAPSTTASPLGSSHNPIRIIQQGNQYTPVQQLTAEQLQQIMQVVQQQQLAKTTSDGGGSSVLFNSQTNTKIVYRVIYPSELHKTAVKIGGHMPDDDGNSQLIHRRSYRKRNRDDEDEKVDAPELSKEEKDARKKHRPRTRSGRVSKPPKHMMKDYKHIHVLDWDEDYDDDDGGYSDFKCSDPEAEEREANKATQQDESSLDAGYGPLRPKRFKCSTCDKCYIGHGGLARHYRLCPSHGSADEPEDCREKSEHADGSIGSFSEDSNTQDSFPNPSSARLASTPSNSNTQDSLPPSVEAVSGPEEISPAVTPRKTYFGRRGRPRSHNSYLHETAAQRQKRRLREIVKASEDEDLMEIVLPRLADALTLWEFLLMKVEKGSPTRPHADIIHREFEKLYKTVHEVCKKYLQPCKNSNMESVNQTSLLKIDNSPINKALDLEAGLYEVKDMPVEESSDFQYTYLTTDKKSSVGLAAPDKFRKTVAVVSSRDLLSPAKRTKMTSLLLNKKSNSVTADKQGSYVSSVISTATPTVTVLAKQQTVSPVASKTVLSSSPSISNSITTSVNSTQAAKPIFRVVSSVTKSQEISKSQESMTCKTVLVSSSPSVSNKSSSGPLVIIGPNSNKLLNNTNMFQNSIMVNGSNMILPNKSCVEDNKTLESLPSSVGEDCNAVSSDIGKAVSSLNGVSSQNILLNGASAMNVQVMEESEEPSTLSMEDAQLEKMANHTVQNIIEPTDNGQSNADAVQKEQTIVDVHNLNNYADDLQNGKEQGEGTQIVTMVQQGTDEEPCEVLQLEGGQGYGGEVAPDFSHASLFQTEDGMYIIQNPDGMAFQLQGAEGIPLETVQALLAMESDAQLQAAETVQTQIQQ